MTPRAGVKTTLASEMRLPGPPIPSGGPNFLGLTVSVFAVSLIPARTNLLFLILFFAKLGDYLRGG
jgi:hypothetical protein